MDGRQGYTECSKTTRHAPGPLANDMLLPLLVTEDMIELSLLLAGGTASEGFLCDAGPEEGTPGLQSCALSTWS